MLKIVTPLYNCSNYIHRCIESIQSQTIKDFSCFLYDDCSTDGTADLIEVIIENDKRFKLIRNTSKFYSSGNHWQASQLKEIEDEDVVVTIDGDDWLSGADVFERILNVYKDPNVWLTYGSYLVFNKENSYEKGSCCLPPDKDNFRNFNVWYASHLRTAKAFLLRSIKKEDLCDSSGSFFSAAGDLALILPMLEMAKNNHWKYLPEINYIYNCETQFNEFRVCFQKSIELTNLIKQKQFYLPLEKQA